MGFSFRAPLFPPCWTGSLGVLGGSWLVFPPALPFPQGAGLRAAAGCGPRVPGCLRVGAAGTPATSGWGTLGCLMLGGSGCGPRAASGWQGARHLRVAGASDCLRVTGVRTASGWGPQAASWCGPWGGSGLPQDGGPGGAGERWPAPATSPAVHFCEVGCVKTNGGSGSRT